MVRPENPFIKEQKKKFFGVINGLNILAALAIHKGTNDVLSGIIEVMHEQTGATIESLEDSITEVLDFIESINQDLVKNGQKAKYIKLKKIDLDFGADDEQKGN